MLLFFFLRILFSWCLRLLPRLYNGQLDPIGFLLRLPLHLNLPVDFLGDLIVFACLFPVEGVHDLVVLGTSLVARLGAKFLRRWSVVFGRLTPG